MEAAIRATGGLSGTSAVPLYKYIQREFPGLRLTETQVRHRLGNLRAKERNAGA